VKAKIVEINTNLAKQIGLKYGLEGGGISSAGLFTAAANMGGSSLNISPALTSFLNTTSYNGVDAQGNPIYSTDQAFKFDSGADKIFALGAQLDLLEKNGAAHLLSEPSILCTNNKEAEIYVGQTMSILTAAQQSTAGVSNVVNNYSREDIGLSLKVKPRLSSNNKVTLEVETILEDIDPSSAQLADRPTTTKRTVKTDVIVNNGEMIILGGLIKKVGGQGVSKVPFLGDIPVLGEALFTHNSDVEMEQNVVIYLTPYIVRKSDDLQKLKAMLSELEDVQTEYNRLVQKNLGKNFSKEIYDDPKDSTGLAPASNRIRRTHEDRLDLLNNTGH
jgi:general secretion pathway protein D